MGENVHTGDGRRHFIDAATNMVIFAARNAKAAKVLCALWLAIFDCRSTKCNYAIP